MASSHRIRALNDQGDTLTNADAHGAEGIARSLACSVATFQFVQGGGYQPGSAHAQGVAQGNGATVRVHVLGIIRQAEVPGNGQGLGGKRLVQLDHIHIGQFPGRLWPEPCGVRVPGQSP